jgi:hypothetical protein
MSSPHFWKSWPSPLKVAYWLLLTIVLFSLLFFAFTYFSGYELMISWKKSAFFQQIPMILDQFAIGPMDIVIEADNLVILQNFVASPLEVNLSVINIFLIFICVSLIILLSISTYLPKVWFYISIGVWIIILSTLRLEMLRLGGSSGYLPLFIIAGSTVIIAYYFHSFDNRFSFLSRAAAFLTSFILFGIVIYLFSGLSYPIAFIASNALIPALLLTIVFTFIIAHEIIAAFIYLLTSSTTSDAKNHIHFLVITFIYLINLVLLYLHHIERVDWNFWYINPYLLLIISSVLGIWGFKQREEQYQHIFSFAPIGGYFYLAMALLAFGTIGFFLGTANDPALEVVKEGIIYGHLGYGLIFLLYVLANFSGPLSKGLKVNKILFRPEQMPYFMYRFAGLIAVFALVIIANWKVPLNYTFAAYYNQQGDLAQLSGKTVVEQGYYQQSRIYAFKNHHANYRLANIYEKRQDKSKASIYYLNAIERTPSAQAYINLSRLYEEDRRFFDALFALEEGAKKLNSGPLYNNLGLIYAKTDIIDSAIYFLQKASTFQESEMTALANIEALAAANAVAAYVDSLDLKEERKNLIAVNNQIVRFNQQGKFYGPEPQVLKDARDDNFFAAGLAYNYLLNTLYHKDTTGISSIITSADRFTEGLYNEKIRFGQAVSEYYHHRVQDAFRRLNALANESYTERALYFKTLGQWALEQEAPDQAAGFFRLARINNAPEAGRLEALSLLADNKVDSANQLLNINPVDSLQESVLNEIILADKSGTSKEKLYYIKYKLPYHDTTAFNDIIATIENENLKAEAIFTFSKKLFEHDLTEDAIKAYGKLAGLNILNRQLYKDIVFFELRLLAAQGNIRNIASQINEQDINFSFKRFPEKVFYTGLLNAVSGDSSAALANLRWTAKNQPFKAMEVVIATEYIKNYTSDRYEVYNLLLEALELNPSSVRLLKAYALEAANLGLRNYSDPTLEDLKKLITQEQYREFVLQYEATVKQQEEAYSQEDPDF